MTTDLRQELKQKSFPKILSIDGGITCDGVKVEQICHKYYDIVPHSIKVGKEDPAPRQRQWDISTHQYLSCDAVYLSQHRQLPK